LFIAGGLLAACGNRSEKDARSLELLAERKKDSIVRVPGEDEYVPEETIRKGEVLIAYSDCAICHREDAKVRGPAFVDIAARYPRNEEYIQLLALKVIGGGRGTWGYAVMTPHPDLPLEDAKAMVTYILSLDIE